MKRNSSNCKQTDENVNKQLKMYTYKWKYKQTDENVNEHVNKQLKM